MTVKQTWSDITMMSLDQMKPMRKLYSVEKLCINFIDLQQKIGEINNHLVYFYTRWTVFTLFSNIYKLHTSRKGTIRVSAADIRI